MTDQLAQIIAITLTTIFMLLLCLPLLDRLPERDESWDLTTGATMIAEQITALQEALNAADDYGTSCYDYNVEWEQGEDGFTTHIREVGDSEHYPDFVIKPVGTFEGRPMVSVRETARNTAPAVIVECHGPAIFALLYA